MSAPDPLVSVCIVSGRRGALLRACLVSLQAQEDAPPFELLVCADADSGVSSMVKEHFPEADIVHVAKTLPGAARNELIPRAHGEILFFLDDDIVAPPRLLRRLVELMATHPEVGVFGGPNVTPPGSSPFQVVQGAVLASAIGAGPVRRRYGDHPFGQADERSFILCNLAVRREAMVPFDSDLVCAEENAVLLELKRRNLGMLYDPDLAVYHERRGTAVGFVRQMFKYGRGRGQVMARRRDGIRATYLAAPALVIYTALAPILAFFTLWALVPIAVYAVMVLAGAVGVAARLRRIGALPLAVVLIVSLHYCYGTGIMAGILRRRRHAGVWPERPSSSGRRPQAPAPPEIGQQSRRSPAPATAEPALESERPAP